MINSISQCRHKQCSVPYEESRKCDHDAAVSQPMITCFDTVQDKHYIDSWVQWSVVLVIISRQQIVSHLAGEGQEAPNVAS